MYQFTYKEYSSIISLIDTRGHRSPVAILPAGVPQYSVLGSTLFSFYINDLPKHLDTQLALFANDTALYSTSWNVVAIKNRIQAHMDAISESGRRWRVTINPEKT